MTALADDSALRRQYRAETPWSLGRGRSAGSRSDVGQRVPRRAAPRPRPARPAGPDRPRSVAGPADAPPGRCTRTEAAQVAAAVDATARIRAGLVRHHSGARRRIAAAGAEPSGTSGSPIRPGTATPSSGGCGSSTCSPTARPPSWWTAADLEPAGPGARPRSRCGLCSTRCRRRNFRDDQPGGDQARARHRRAVPGEGLPHVPARPRHQRRAAAAGRPGRVRGRPQPGRHAPARSCSATT